MLLHRLGLGSADRIYAPMNPASIAKYALGWFHNWTPKKFLVQGSEGFLPEGIEFAGLVGG